MNGPAAAFPGSGLSAIIVSYNCKELLVEAIRSVQQFVAVPHEIIVVDNASADGTPETIRRLFPEVQLIANSNNLGFSAANNQGFARSKGEYILLLNPDAKLINADISKALAFLSAHPDTILGPKILNPDLSLQDSVYAFPSWADVPAEAFFLTYFSKGDLQAIIETGNYALSGACLLIPRHYYTLLNGLDNDLFWMDDVDFCLRAKQQGAAIRYFPDWSVVHVIGESGKKNYKLSISNQLISKLKFFKKHGQRFNFIVSVIFLQIHIALRIILFLPLTPFKPVYRAKFSAYCYSQTLFFRYIFTHKKNTF